MGWWAKVAAMVMPEACVACDVVLGEGVVAFCQDCAERVLESPSVCCERCAEPGAFAKGWCERCITSPPEFGRAWAPFEHEGSIARAIHRFKYEDRADLARPLGELIAGHSLAVLRGLVVPVPLHEERFCSRRFDQGALLAVAVARAARLRVDVSALRRVRATVRQVGLNEYERAANVSRAFEASGAVSGHSVLLVDDVYTTGATAREATCALLAQGAREVNVVTLARARRESTVGTLA
jgi:ComF family protein